MDNKDVIIHNLIKALVLISVVSIVCVAFTASLLVWFLNQYNFTSTETVIQQDGVGVNVYTDNNSISEVVYGAESK